MTPDPFTDLFRGLTRATETVVRCDTTPKGGSVTVSVERAGKPKPDLSGFDVTERHVVLTMTDGKTSITFRADHAACDLADALDQAAATIRAEESK